MCVTYNWLPKGFEITRSGNPSKFFGWFGLTALEITIPWPNTTKTIKYSMLQSKELEGGNKSNILC